MKIAFASGIIAKDAALSSLMGEEIFNVELFDAAGRRVYTGPMDATEAAPLVKSEKVIHEI